MTIEYNFGLDTDDSDPVVQAVINRFKERSQLGLKKYGVTMQDSKLPTLAWIQNAQEEAMDLILYLERLKQDLKGN